LTALPSADRRPVSDLPELHGAGLYAFYLNDPEQLAPIETGENGLVYIGMTQDDLHVRNHLLHQISGFSTLRRSFGALLKTRLNLVAIARGRGSSESNFRNYCFTPDGEQRLSQWMADHLLAVQWTADRDAVKAMETMLIQRHCPPLNLMENPANRWRRHVMDRRALCAAEARAGYRAA